MQWLNLLLLLLSVLPPSARGEGAPKEQRIHNFQLRDARGETHQLSEWHQKKLVVVVFLGVDCPLSRLYGPRLAEMARAFAPRGVGFVAIDANQQDAPSDLLRYLRDHPLPFPLLKDVGNVVADQFGAERNPEVFVLDERRMVRYRGRIDDQYLPGVQRSNPSRRDLEIALEELLSGREASRPYCQASGCHISRLRKLPARGAITYYRDIAPILQKHCQSCHRPGEIAPFSLISYKDAAGSAATIREVVADRRMPPWHADPRFGKFANDPSLSEHEKQLLFTWIDSGCPQGDPVEEKPPEPVSAQGWHIPTPDLVVSMLEPFTVPAEGTVDYQYFVVDPGFREDRWIQAAEVRPGNRAVVHHCNIFLQPPGSNEVQVQGDLESCWLVTFVPGHSALVLPEGMAKRVPAGWRLVFGMHYTAVGSVQTDQTSVALKFADPRTVKKEVATRAMIDLDLSIPPRVAEHRVVQTWRINCDVLLLSLFPHLHLRGKSFRYEAIYPDGTSEILLDVPRYDFNWQHRYELVEPKRLPSGSLLRCTAVYDNSANNPLNPNPDAEVHEGPQSWDEMFRGYFDVALADQDLTRPVPLYIQAWETLRTLFRPGVVVLFVGLGCTYLMRRRLAMLLQTSEQ